MIPPKDCKILKPQRSEKPSCSTRRRGLCRKGRLGKAPSPLTLVRCLLGLLQLLQSCCQSLLGTIQLFLNQLDASVQRSYIGFSLGRDSERHFRLGEKVRARLYKVAEPETPILDRKPALG